MIMRKNFVHFPVVLMSLVLAGLLAFLPATASAQGYGFIQDDYDQYAQSFKNGKEPNFTTSESWRRKYAKHLWAEYAEGDEYREPMHAAQVLTGIYLTQHVDHRLTYQIQNIILGKAAMSSVLAERITLDEIHAYLTSDSDVREKMRSRTSTSAGSLGGSGTAGGMTGGGAGASSLGGMGAGGRGGVGGGSTGTGSRSFYSDVELSRIYAMNRNIDAVARRKIVSGSFINRGQRIEIRSIENLFDHGEKGWVPTYYFMREKFNILNELADSFTFNWDEERREAEIEKMMEDPKIKREHEKKEQTARLAQTARAMTGGNNRMGGNMMGGVPMGAPVAPPPGGGLTAEQVKAAMTAAGIDPDTLDALGVDLDSVISRLPGLGVSSGVDKEEQKLRDFVEEKMKTRERRELAYKYIVGVYESSDFHLAELRKIRRYFETTAEQGDPIAQFHLALFLRYLGEFVDPEVDESTRIYKSEEWLDKAAATSNEMKKRVEILRVQIAAEGEKQDKRDFDRAQKMLALVKVEKEKLDLFDTVLLSVLANIKSGDSMGGGMRGGMAGGMGGMGGGMRGGTGGGRQISESSMRQIQNTPTGLAQGVGK